MAAEHERRLADYEGQVAQLQETIKGLEEEVVVLRRRLQDAPKRVRTLEERLLETKGQLAQAVSKTKSFRPTPVKAASTSRHFGKKATNSRFRPPPTGRISGPTTTAPSA